MESSDKQREVVTQAMERIREIIGTSHEAIQQLSKMNIHVATATRKQSTVSSEITERISVIAFLADEIGSSSTKSKS